MQSFYISVFNFTVLVVLLVYKLRQPTKDFVKQRYETIKNEIQVVKDQLDQAEQRYKEFSSKLQLVEQEIKTLREQARQDATRAKENIIQEAEKLAKLVVSDTKAASETLFAELKVELYSELSLKVLDRAEAILKERLTGDDRARIRQEFSRQLETIR